MNYNDFAIAYYTVNNMIHVLVVTPEGLLRWSNDESNYLWHPDVLIRVYKKKKIVFYQEPYYLP